MTNVAGIEVPSTSPIFLTIVGFHILLGLACLITGAAAMLSPKCQGRHPNFGTIYFWCLSAVVASASGLSAVRWTRDYALFILGALSFAAALIGRTARRKCWPGWVRWHITGMGVSYVLLLTAFYMDNGKSLPLWKELPPIAYWLLPGAIGGPIIVRAVLRHPLASRIEVSESPQKMNAMKKYINLTGWALLLPALGSFIMPRTVHAQSATAALNLGDILPDISGQTPSGSSLRLSDMVAGKISVVVFSFSKTAGKDAQLWNDHLYKDYGSRGLFAGSTVIMLEAAPKLLRGLIVSKLKSSMPSSMRDKTIVSYQDEKLWKQRLSVADDSYGYVLLLEPDGHMRWRNSGAFSDAEYTELRNRVQEQLQLANQRKPQ